MSTSIRDVRPADLAAVSALNEAVVPHVNSLSRDELEWHAARAAYFRVVESGGAVAGFLVGFTPRAGYTSLNFQWFKQRYPSFVYIDRIAVSARHRRRGLAGLLYDDIERFSRAYAELLTCEVNIRPPNEGSMRFHESRGFTEVGTQASEGGAKQVRLLAKHL